MAYLGNSPVLSQQEYRNIDNISGSFNGSTTSFALLVNGVAPVPAPQSSNQCLISVNGVVQKPDDTGATGFRISGGNIIFSSAPTGGQSFFGVILAGADYIYAGENFPDGTVSAPSITFNQDLDTGFYRSGAGEIKYTANGTAVVTLSSNNLTAPSFIPTSSSAPTNGVYLPAANTVGISTNGSGRLFVDASGRILVGTSAALSNVYVNGSVGTPSAQIEGSTYQTAGLSITRTTNAAPFIYLNSGSSGNNANDALGQIVFNGYDGANYRTAALINAAVDGTPGSADMPGRIVFSTTADGASSVSERMRITSAGLVGIGTSSPSNNFHVVGDSDSGRQLRLSGGSSNAMIKAVSPNRTFSFGATTSNFTIYDDDAAVHRLFINSSGNVGIGTTSPKSILTANGNIVGLNAGTHSWQHYQQASSAYTVTSIDSVISGASGSLVFKTGTNWTNADAIEQARIDSSGRLLVGTSSSYGVGSSAQAKFQASDTTSNIHASFTDWSTADSGGIIVLGKAKGGSAGNYTIVANGNVLGEIRFAGADGTDLETNGASIRAEVDGTPGSNDMPGRLVFSTTADGASSPTERLRIANNGAWGLAGANYGSSGQVLTSNGSGSAPSWSTPSGIGTGQTWQNVTGSRAFGTTYTNSTGKPIMVVIAFAYPGAGAAGVLTVDGVAIQFGQVNAAYINLASGTAIVPNGSTYAFNTTTTINNWLELR